SDIENLLLNNANRVILVGGLKGLIGSTTVTTGAFPAISQARVAFRVRTNRQRSDQSSTVSYDGSATINNGSNYGLAVVDDIYFSNAIAASGGGNPTGN